MNNFQMKDLVYMNSFEKNFSVNFSPYINEYNAIGLMEELNKAQQHIIQNVNAKMVFFDFVLKIIVLLKH
jgi:DNA polymerase-3 subunit delta'